MNVTDAEQTASPWWSSFIIGIAAVILGIMLLAAPGATTILVIQILGIYWLVAGVLAIVRIFLGRNRLSLGWALLQGIIGIVAGLVILNHPLWSTVLVPTILVSILAVLGILYGVIDLVEAFRGAGWGRGALGVLNLLFGLLLLGSPLIVASWLPTILGAVGVIGGLLVAVGSYRTREDVDWLQLSRY